MIGRRYRAARLWTWNLFTPSRGDRLGYWTDWFIMALIAANVTAVILETVDALAAAFGPQFFYFEVFSVAVFTVEYVGRVWAAVEHDEYRGLITGRLRFASRPLLIVDFLAILPFYLTAAGVGIDLRFLRALRLIRLFRLLKLARYSEAIRSFAAVFERKKERLLLAVFANGLLLVLASSTIYYIEHPHQPEAFSSIPASFYWGFITLTTVGYGDVTPVTPLGRALTGIIALLGIGLFALPASILASGFMEEREEDAETEDADEEWEYCPHCGERLE